MFAAALLAFLALAGTAAATLWRWQAITEGEIQAGRAERARVEAEIERRERGRAMRRVPVEIETERGALREAA